MAQPLYQIVEIPRRGNGNVASRDISKGKLILQKDPLIVMYTGVPHEDWDANTFHDDERASRSNRINTALADAHQANKSTFEAAGGLYDGNVVPC